MISKKQKRASRNRMACRLGKKKAGQTPTWVTMMHEGELIHVPVNRLAIREAAARMASAPGRSMRQMAREKRKARIVSMRRKAEKVASKARAINRVFL